MGIPQASDASPARHIDIATAPCPEGCSGPGRSSRRSARSKSSARPLHAVQSEDRRAPIRLPPTVFPFHDLQSQMAVAVRPSIRDSSGAVTHANDSVLCSERNGTDTRPGLRHERLLEGVFGVLVIPHPLPRKQHQSRTMRGQPVAGVTTNRVHLILLSQDTARRRIYLQAGDSERNGVR
jgi:hypothetical protein